MHLSVAPVIPALTDHEHWGMPFLDRDPEMWEEIRRQTHLFNEPGRFLTLLGDVRSYYSFGRGLYTFALRASGALTKSFTTLS